MEYLLKGRLSQKNHFIFHCFLADNSYNMQKNFFDDNLLFLKDFPYDINYSDFKI